MAVTAPIIAEAAAKAADANRIELLPEADGFEAIEVEVEGVTEMHKATNGVGYVISAQGNGYGGNGSVKLMIAYDNEGNINFGGNGGNNSGSNDNSGDNSGGNHFGGNDDPFDNGDDSDGDSVVFG